MGYFAKRLVDVAAVHRRTLVVDDVWVLLQPGLHLVLAHLSIVHPVNFVPQDKKWHQVRVFRHCLHQEFLLPYR